MAELNKKYLDLAGTSYLWGKIKAKIEALNSEISAVGKSGKAADVSIEDAGSLITAANVEAALAELATKINSNATAGAVTVEKAKDAGEFAAKYIVKQGGQAVGATIDIAKDLFVKSGSVVENPDGKAAGTYIELVLQNQAAPLYIPVDSLIEYVTGNSAETDAIQIHINDQHQVTASVKTGSLTKEMLDAGVQGSLDKADSAMQQADLNGLKAELVGAAGDNAANKVTITAMKEKIEAVNTELDGRLDALELKAGDTSVADQITAAVNALDATPSQTAAKANGYLNLSLTQVNGVVTGISGSIPADTYDAHGSAAAVKTELLGGDSDTGASNTIAGAKKYADGLNTAMDARVDALEAKAGATSVSEQITAAINNLDAQVSQAAAPSGLALSLTQENGVVTGISGSIATITTAEIDAICAESATV